MSKVMIRIFSLILCFVTVASVLAACNDEQIAPAENLGVGNNSLSNHAQSPDIKIDGVLDEAVWQNKGWFRNTYRDNVGGNLPVLELTAFPTEYGVYIASKVTDSCLSNDGERFPNYNSNWELYIAACNAGESLYSVENNGEWNMRRIYVDVRGESMSLYTNTDRAVKVDGELNSNATNGATLEMFVTWETLNIDVSKGIPESIGILPCYRATLTSGANTTWMSPLDSNISSTMSCFIFDKDGYISADAENCVVGDAFHGYAKSRGWDISQEAQGIVRSVQGEWCRIFFSEAYGENFIVEATLIPVAGINDAWPKAGIYFQKTDGKHYSVWLDAMGADSLVDSINGTKNFPGYNLVTFDQVVSGWNQVSLSGYDTVNPNATKQEGVKLTVIKYGDNFWYFADGKYLTTQKVEWMAGDCIPGFFSLGFEVIYKDYSCKEITLENLTEYLNASEQYVITASVDGNGGEVSVNKASIAGGDSYDLSFYTESGYQITSVMINGQEKLEDVKANAKNGIYTVTNAQGNQDIVVTYEKLDGIVYSGSVTDGEEGIAASMILVNQKDGTAYYTGEVTGRRGFKFIVPAGTYTVMVQTEGNQWQSKTVDITADMEDTIVYKGMPEIPENWDSFRADAAASRANSYAANGNDGKTTIFVGDSFFDPEFWTTFQSDLSGKDALCLGIGSTTAEDWYNYILRDVFLQDIVPKNIVLNIGNNDVYGGLSGEACAENIQKLVKLLHNLMPNTNIYLFSVTPRADGNSSGVQSVNALMDTWCAEQDYVTFLNIFDELTTDMLSDGIHPKTQYYSTVFVKALQDAGCIIEDK